MDPADENCIEQCLNGQPDEFRQLIGRYERPIMSYLQTRMGDAEAAAEATQETFVRAFFRLNKLKRGGAFFPWVLGIAHRVMLESFRRRRRAISLSRAADQVADASADDFENDGELAAAVAHLPDVYREVTILRYFGGLSCNEVAERLGVPLGTVTKRLSRAYALLRDALESRSRSLQTHEVRR
jgi:RNA polymerase sigma-70 factor (ECF subfamily)